MEIFLYNIIIYPLVQMFDLCYLFLFRVFDNHGISVIGVSFAVSIFTLPLYFEAEKWQQAERTIREKLADKAAKIKAVFRGDERYMVLSAFYRQNHYHPVYSLRSSIGLFLQIPFFIAAYSYLSKLDTLMGTPFMGIANLGAPDGLLKIQSGHGVIFTVNLLPILMTIINIAASIIYIKNFNTSHSSLKEKVQLFGVAVVFLVLLYNSPSALVLYWTFNNLFSLVKNILQKTKYARNIIFLATCLCGVLLAVFVLFFHHGVLYKRLFVALAGLSVLIIPFIVKKINLIIGKLRAILNNQEAAVKQTSTIIFASFILFLLLGIVIPTSLIASSVEEFSFIEQYTSPFPFIFNTAQQAFGFFVFWVFCVYFLMRGNVKYFLTAFVTIISICVLINAFVFVGNYGVLTIQMKFDTKELLIPSLFLLLTNIFILFALCGLIFFLLFCRKKQILQFFQIIMLIALFSAGVYRTAGIYHEFRLVNNQKDRDRDTFAALSSDSQNADGYAPVYEFSKTGKNVLIIMMDRAIPGFIPEILIEKPELKEQLSGFTFFPNSISFGTHTIHGAPALFGGYEYAPAEINTKRLNETFTKKYNESFLVLPQMFLENNCKVTITDPPLYEETIQNVFARFPEIKAANIMNKYTEDWLSRHPDVQRFSVSNLLNNRLIYFSFLKCAPLMFRYYIYDHGHWLAAENGNTPLKTIDNYSMLDILPEITSFSQMDQNTLTMMVNMLPHEPALLQAPDYTIPPVSSTNKGNGPLALDEYYHINMASLLLLGKWFMFLKENGVYNNTRIIVVSDHGINSFSKFDGNIILPTGECLQFYTALLLFKDFNADEFTIDNQFMVNADTPIFAVKDIIPNPVNPFTQRPLKAEKEGGVTITSSQNFNKPQYHNRYNIAPTEWLHVHDSIFDPKNWKKVKIEKID
jgi:membrane protein insertase Oxa1/YidC/SpoIIIJ